MQVDAGALAISGLKLDPLPEQAIRNIKDPAATRFREMVQREDMSAEEAHHVLAGKIPLALLSQLMAYQRIGVVSAVMQQGRVLLGDEMGLGKTLRWQIACLPNITILIHH